MRQLLILAAVLSATVPAQAERIPISLSIRGIDDLGPNTNQRFIAVPPNTLTLSTNQFPWTVEDPGFTELTLTDIEPDSIDRMLSYTRDDPPSYSWVINAENADAFGVDWLGFQSRLNERMQRDVLVDLEFFHLAPPSNFNPIAGGGDTIADFLLRTGVQKAGEPALWATDFLLHEVEIYIDYYFWHPVLEGLRHVQMRAEIRGEARIKMIPEPASWWLVSLAMCFVRMRVRYEF